MSVKRKEKDNEKGVKVREAAALRYSQDVNIAPEIVALGKGELAEKILEKAKENNVPVYRDEKLAHMLNRLKLGDEIPEELYEVVAEILVFVGNLDRDYSERCGGKK